nr:unnamed protein product [Callosobruchus analis]
MPKRCCVLRCKGNYDSSLKVEGRKTVFCLYFNSGDIVKKGDIIALPHGTTKIFPGRPKLKENAAPAMFANLPK